MIRRRPISPSGRSSRLPRRREARSGESPRNRREHPGGVPFLARRRRRAPVVLLRPAARADLDRAPRVAEVPRRRHQDDRSLHARAGAVDLQIPLGAADGPLQPALPRPQAVVDAAVPDPDCLRLDPSRLAGRKPRHRGRGGHRSLHRVPLAAVVIASPEPKASIRPPTTLRAAVFDPFVSLFRKPRAPEIIAFILLYKLADNLATALVRPFLIEKCYSAADVGLATATIGLVFTIGGTIFGAALTRKIGVGRALWIFGVLQALACLGYVVVDRVASRVISQPCTGPMSSAAGQPLANRVIMYAAMALETACQGMATGAFDVFLIRLTQKRFSATQYALFASIFALSRTLAGAPAGFLVDAMGWTPFFLSTIFAAIPGLWMLHRFVSFGTREPDLDLEEVH